MYGASLPRHYPAPIKILSDAEVLTLTALGLPPTQDRRLSALLEQQVGILTDSERGELVTLMQIYQEGLLRKAQAMQEAARRGPPDILQLTTNN